MNFWFVIHDLQSYRQHPNWIGGKVKKPGKKEPADRSFKSIAPGDKIIYYARGDKYIVGIFEVTSNMEYVANDSEWNERMIFQIKPDSMPPNGQILDFKAFLFDSDVQLELFPDKKRWMYQLWGHTCRQISEQDFERIQSNLANEKYLTQKPRHSELSRPKLDSTIKNRISEIRNQFLTEFIPWWPMS